ncbi:hypothetical protein FSP39_023330 [Pinctada imbricata]|uniref:Uncharacterized protein n=1 Tax=Pinctada imbricata TaxID=66713 RepID=A0AA88Y628_PINIB|nr:hypothetical protein FSP39_023330 [Pinctada imbricata]
MATPAKVRKRTPSFRIEFSGSEEKKCEIFEKLQKVRNTLTQKENKLYGNVQVLEHLFDLFFQQHTDLENSVDNAVENQVNMTTYVKATKTNVNQKIFMCAEKSLRKIVEAVESHSRICAEKLDMCQMKRRGHVIMSHFRCNSSQHPHKFLWSSSPYMPNKEYLVNNRVNHGLICSGMLPSHYTRFVDGSGIGKISKEKRDSFFKSYNQHIKSECEDSISTAVLEEIAAYADETIGEVNIMTDARHGWRKNAKDTSVVALGERTHKVLSCQHITKRDDPVTQRHEKIGTERIYDFLKENEASIGIHTHDRNLLINKYIRENSDATNQNDTWHCVKSLKGALKKATNGPKHLEGETWSFQLGDKAEPVPTHVHWSIRNCNGDSAQLRQSLDNIV